MAQAVKEERTYRIFGYKGKQVRDNIHSIDVCTAFMAFYENPHIAAVYNLGGGRANSTSIIEAIARFGELTGKNLKTIYINQPRKGDHICYISNINRFKSDYPGWEITRTLNDIFKELSKKK